MTNLLKRAADGFSPAMILLVAALVMGAAFALPRPAHAVAAGSVEECVDKEFAQYNVCLQNAGTSWGRKLCDIYFQAGFAICLATILGDVKNAVTNGSAS